ncbi:hypothetical protein EV130_106208 [Rhizobium azibense]|nr:MULTISPECIES: hypothetical protein [Rhizobium]TCU24616.1 hypothetical protein EV130_106208 [Rhizobium azibense]TCU39364.1 hypothetical protein EV129_103210 [Rhizobium azibense]
MVQTIINRSEVPLDARDLEMCQSVFDEVRSEAKIAKVSDEAERIAAITIELYRQGVRSPHHLKVMVEAARGLIAPRKVE